MIRYNFLKGILIVCLFFVFQNLHSQYNLLCNPGFENLLTYKINNLNIDGEFVLQESKEDTFFILSDRMNSEVMTESWNYSDAENKIFNGFFSRTGLSRTGRGYGQFTPFYHIEIDRCNVSNIVGRFCKPLEKGQIYNLVFWIKPYSGNVYLDKIGVALVVNEKPIFKTIENKKIRFETEMNNSIVKYIEVGKHKEDQYKKCEINLIAKGGERFVIIGNPDFAYPRNYKRKEYRNYRKSLRNKPPASCRYRIDDVVFSNISNLLDSCTIKTNELYKKNISDLETDSNIQFSLDTDEEKENELLLKDELNIFEIRDTVLSVELFFGKDIHELSKDEKSKLLVLDNIRNEINVEKIELYGYSDSDGRLEYNLLLSERRAKYVKGVISQIQIVDDKLIQLFYRGENETKYDDHALNRRVEVVIKGKYRSLIDTKNDKSMVRSH